MKLELTPAFALLLAISITLLLPGPSVAAPKDGLATIVGAVIDESGPLPGAIVLLKGTPGEKPLSALTDGAGAYRFVKVPPAQYVIEVSFAGGATIRRDGIKASAGETVTVQPISMVQEVVSVVADSEKIETKTTTLGRNFVNEKIDSLPVGRSYQAVISLAPGITGDDGTGGKSVYGASGLESGYVIDGVNTTSVQSGSAGKQLNFDFIDTIEVKTGGYEAEFGRATGALVNVQTKSGGNEFHGGLGYFVTPSSLSSRAQLDDFQTQEDTIQRRETSAHLGGYLVKDKLLFFLAYSPTVTTSTRIQRNPDVYFRQNATTEGDEKLWSAKLTWQVSTNHRIAFSGFGDPTSVSRQSDLYGFEQDRKEVHGGTDASIRYTGVLAADWVVEAQVGIHNESVEVEPIGFSLGINDHGTPNDPSDDFVDRRLSPPSLRQKVDAAFSNSHLGTDSIFQAFGPYPYPGQDKANRQFGRYTIDFSGGKHSLKSGVEYERSQVEQLLQYGYGTGMALEFTNDTDPTDQTHPPRSILGVRRCWGDGQGHCLDWAHQPDLTSRTATYAVFAQDGWQIVPELRLNYGLRYEVQEFRNDRGKLLSRIDDSIAPRLGATWDVRGDGRSRLFASAGRYYEEIPTDVMSRAAQPRLFSTRLYATSTQETRKYWSWNEFNANIRQRGICTSDPADNNRHPNCWDFEGDVAHDSAGNPLVPVLVRDFGTPFAAPIDPKLHAGSQDEFVAGYEFEPFGGWITGAKLIKRRVNDVVEDISLDYGQTFIIANPGGDYRFFVDPRDAALVATAQQLGCAPGRLCQVSNSELAAKGFSSFPRPKRDFKGLELTARKNFSRNWTLNASYLLSRTEGNYRGRFFKYSEERDPNITEAFDFPWVTYNANGLLPQDRTHVFKVNGEYAWPSGTVLGAAMNVRSGTPRSATTDPEGGTTPFYGGVFILERGAAGRTPTLSDFDLRWSHKWEVRKGVQMGLYVDVFNVLNQQKVTGYEQQWVQSGSGEGLVCSGYGGCYYSSVTGGEPSTAYVDTVFGNGDGVANAKEWDRWAHSIQGRFHSLGQAYHYFRTKTFDYTVGGVTSKVDAYPGFAACPAEMPGDPRRCIGIFDFYGDSNSRQQPRTVRLGVKLSF